MVSWKQFNQFSLEQKVNTLYREGKFIVSIRYYGFKINLYLLAGTYIEVFYNHKKDRIDKISQLDTGHTRMKFYFDQIKLPKEITSVYNQ